MRSVWFLGVCFLETYSVLWGDVWINKNFACGPKCSTFPSLYAGMPGVWSCKPPEGYEASPLRHLCLEIWSYLLFSAMFFYLRPPNTHKWWCCGGNETAEPPLRARGALRFIIAQHIYRKWKEMIWCGIQHFCTNTNLDGSYYIGLFFWKRKLPSKPKQQ